VNVITNSQSSERITYKNTFMNAKCVPKTLKVESGKSPSQSSGAGLLTDSLCLSVLMSPTTSKQTVFSHRQLTDLSHMTSDGIVMGHRAELNLH